MNPTAPQTRMARYFPSCCPACPASEPSVIASTSGTAPAESTLMAPMSNATPAVVAANGSAAKQIAAAAQEKATDDAALRAAAIGEPAPRGGRGHARDLRPREEKRDLAGVQSAPREIERKVGDEHAGIGEEGEVERREPRRRRPWQGHAN